MEAPPLIENLKLKECVQCRELCFIEEDIVICSDCNKQNLALIEWLLPKEAQK